MDIQTINRAKQLIEIHGFDVVFSHIENEMKKAKSPDEYRVFLKMLIHSYEADTAALGVHIESPFALSEESVKEIKASLDAANSPHTFTINKSLLGGFVATHNYQKIDASLQSALKRLEV